MGTHVRTAAARTSGGRARRRRAALLALHSGIADQRTQNTAPPVVRAERAPADAGRRAAFAARCRGNDHALGRIDTHRLAGGAADRRKAVDPCSGLRDRSRFRHWVAERTLARGQARAGDRASQPGAVRPHLLDKPADGRAAACLRHPEASHLATAKLGQRQRPGRRGAGATLSRYMAARDARGRAIFGQHRQQAGHRHRRRGGEAAASSRRHRVRHLRPRPQPRAVAGAVRGAGQRSTATSCSR